ncbi:hypothetical protein E0J16_34070 [Rhizobium pisi]|uniref:hypothetical protein n=1 Tax=Rhizobium pisi TaxID=574561 RepID=UPI00103CDD1E|nr:hypothetical protein [Rhizobium pisi]TCA41717.1 hypothetical protein E0J16_34070 [Rhizobium pisi]
MTEHSSDATTPADHLLRTTEMEAVVMNLREKVKDLTAPESPELTEVNEAIDRLYKIVLYGAATAGTGSWGSDPRAETYFDDPDRHRSLFSVVLGADGYGAGWTQFLTVTTSSSVMRLTYGNETDIAAWLDTNGKSLANVVADATDLLDALDGTSLVGKAIGTPEMINAIGTNRAQTGVRRRHPGSELDNLAPVFG